MAIFLSEPVRSVLGLVIVLSCKLNVAGIMFVPPAIPRSDVNEFPFSDKVWVRDEPVAAPAREKVAE